MLSFYRRVHFARSFHLLPAIFLSFADETFCKKYAKYFPELTQIRRKSGQAESCFFAFEEFSTWNFHFAHLP